MTEIIYSPLLAKTAAVLTELERQGELNETDWQTLDKALHKTTIECTAGLLSSRKLSRFGRRPRRRR